MAIPKCTGKFNSSDSNPIAKVGEAKMAGGDSSVRAWIQKPDKTGKRKPQHVVKRGQGPG